MEIDPLVSIIVVNFNGRKYLKACFDSLYAGLYKNIEIIFVDNGSSDQSADLVRQNYSKIKVIELGKNLGLSIASNRGAAAAGGKYLFFYNNDTIGDPKLVEYLARALEADPLIGVAGCKTYTYNGGALINAGVPCDIFGYPYGKAPPFYVDAAIFISNDLFNRLGGFDEKMFLYGEDRDLCWRTWLYGYKVSVVPDAVFFHDSACMAGSGKFSTTIFKRFSGEYNSLRSILKNYSPGFLIFVLPAFMLINFAEVVVFFIKGEFSVIKNVYLRSYRENLRDFPGLLVLRRKLQKERKVPDFAIIRRMDKISGKLRLLFKAGIPKFNQPDKYGV